MVPLFNISIILTCLLQNVIKHKPPECDEIIFSALINNSIFSLKDNSSSTTYSKSYFLNYSKKSTSFRIYLFIMPL